MIRLLFAGLAALWLSGCGTGGEKARDWPPPHPALWEVTSPAGERGWLFGTVHALPAGVEWRTPALDAQLAEARTLVVEIADLVDTGAANAAFSARSPSAGLPPLTQRVPAADRPALRALMERAGLSEDDVAGMESWAAALVLANAARAAEPGNGVDRALLATGKPVLGLESFADQFDRFDRLPPTAQTDFLVAVSREAETEDEDGAIVAWLTGDLPTLEKQAEQGILSFPELRRALLVDRNRNWAPRIAALIDGGRRPFVAVGAAHLLGADGLPALLEAAGYRVQRIQ
ncbi:conserved hypothetical protein [Altererythrobacter sp. B11]|uniref:TraB/GumN family protein n=1 Tax=Altererythrobacter sp. B11 TaxID=2060312 RepID=UPI000DC740E2|nr:TraB/GumN family protein [Altererythrobacter sp. B11]BBC73074.1 conserved hypothetical protein [Altererythrobacter sp. B11]